jgi:phosphopantothenoylcysteine synthetase/decarboxylase
MKVLITAGGTSDPIDGVRFITNFSTGKTGATIADEFAMKSHEVVFLHSKHSVRPTSFNVICKSFFTYEDLDSLLFKELSSHKYDLVVHAAAVSDFTVDKIRTDGKTFVKGVDKIPTSGNLTIEMKSTQKILDKLKEYSLNKNLKVVAFKLTNTEDQNLRTQAALKAIQNPFVDALVYNDLSEIDGSKHSGSFIVGSLKENFETKKDLAKKVVNFAEGIL